MDDARARLPESNSVLGTCRGQKVVDLLVDVLGPLQILLALDLGLDQVIAMDCGWHCHFGQARGDELEHSHLSCSVLHGNPVRSKTEVALPTLDILHQKRVATLGFH